MFRIEPITWLALSSLYFCTLHRVCIPIHLIRRGSARRSWVDVSVWDERRQAGVSVAAVSDDADWDGSLSLSGGASSGARRCAAIRCAAVCWRTLRCCAVRGSVPPATAPQPQPQPQQDRAGCASRRVGARARASLAAGCGRAIRGGMSARWITRPFFHTHARLYWELGKDDDDARRSKPSQAKPSHATLGHATPSRTPPARPDDVDTLRRVRGMHSHARHLLGAPRGGSAREYWSCLPPQSCRAGKIRKNGRLTVAPPRRPLEQTLSAALLCDPAAAPHDPYTDATSGAPYRIVREPVCRQGHAIHGGDGAHQTDPWRKRSPSPAPAPFGLAGLGIASSLLSVAPDIVKGAAKVL